MTAHEYQHDVHDHRDDEHHEHGPSDAYPVAHGHGHRHGHGHDHDHDHGSGIIGWFRGTFAHSHDIQDKVDESLETHERGIWVLKISLLGLGATALIQVTIVLLSSSVALLADTIHN